MATKVLLISPYGEEIAGCFGEYDYVEWRTEPNLDLNDDTTKFDWIVSYGCRQIIREPWLTIYKNRILNVHISYLPFNKGADPNFWSWFNHTPKGVTVHLIDSGMDTGDIIEQAEVRFNSPEKHTLATSYQVLRKAAPAVFECAWHNIGKGNYKPEPQKGSPNYPTHKSADKKKWMDMLPLGWDTPVLDVERLGNLQRGVLIQ